MNARTFIVTIFFGLLVAVTGSASWFYLSFRDNPPLPILGNSPRFTLMDESGNPFSSDELKGKVSVANFFFASCPGMCPLISRNIASVRDKLKSKEGLAFLSISVDPQRDTPEVLTEYARKFRDRAGDWRFVTGPRSDLKYIATDGFKLGFEDEIALHTTKAILIDKKQRIRGYYDALDHDAMEKLARDMKRLLGE